MAEKIAAKNKNVSQIGLSTHNQDHEMNPAAFSTTKIRVKATTGSCPCRSYRLDSFFMCIITSRFQFANCIIYCIALQATCHFNLYQAVRPLLMSLGCGIFWNYPYLNTYALLNLNSRYPIGIRRRGLFRD